MSNWKVYSEGLIQDSADHETVVNNIQKLFKINRERALQLVSNSRKLIKVCSSESEANKYLAAADKIGFVASIDAPPSSKEGLSLASVEAQDNPSNDVGTNTTSNHSINLKPNRMQCPKCDKEQEKKSTCTFCGIFIDKYIPQQPVNIDDSHGANINPTDPLDIILNNKLISIVLLLISFFIATHYLASPTADEIGSTPMARANIASLEHALQLPSIKKEELRQLLASGNFSALEKRLGHMIENMNTDIQWEYPLMNTLYAISSENGIRNSYLNSWVSSTNSALSYLARAYFNHNEGWRARGSESAVKTSKEQMKNLSTYHTRAMKDFQHAKSKNKYLLPIYTGLISIARSQSSIDVLSTLNEATELFPAGYSFRNQYGKYILPQWFGSDAMLDAFSDKVEPYIDLNPRLSNILGLKDAEKGRKAFARENDSRCIRMHNNALSYGITALSLYRRSYCLMMDGQYESAIIDANLSLKIEHHKHVIQVKQYSEHKIR
jgi:hypothetical protein